MYKLKLLFPILFILSLFYSCGQKRLNYPRAKKTDIVDDYFGTKVADPYRWLEDAESEETKAWVDAENRITFSYIHSSPAYTKIKRRLTELWNYPKYSAPVKKGGWYFFRKNDGLQNQAVVYKQKSLEAAPQVLLDPNILSADGTVAVSNLSFSHDGKYLAYGLSKSGSDWQEFKIRKVENNRDFDETINWCKFSSIAWKKDNSGFFYNRFPKEGTVAEQDRNNFNRVYWHKLGTAQSADKIVYEDPNHKELGFSPHITKDGKYLLLTVWKGTDPRNRIYYRKTNSKGKFIKLLDKADASYSFIFNEGPLFYFRTDLNAPRGRVIAVDIRKPQPGNWRELIPQGKDVLDYVKVVNNQFVASYMHDAHNQIKIFNKDGSYDKEIKLPEIGSVYGFSGEARDKEMFITFTSYLYPPAIFRYNFNSGTMDIFRKPKIKFDPSVYKTEQIFYKSKDGTQVPMFIIHKKNLILNGENPTILYGYGGFDISLTPAFSVSRLVWLEQGGVYAVANLRGGGEYGEAWHKAGMLENKQNVFDDFIAAAEWLIEHKYTNRKRLAINGGSNGGLLTAAVMLQRPDLFGAVLCQVPVIDMLRYHKFTVGRYWTPEYGNAEESEKDFKFLYAYSPLHNVKENVDYPSILLTTADTDNRVAPLHAKKFAATLQEKYKGRNPILLRVEIKAGHGGGKPTAKRIEEASDLYTYLLKVFRLDR